MKGHKAHHHKHRSTGGVNDAEEDLREHPHRYNSSHVEDEAEERKHGGHVKRHRRKHGGHVHHEKMEHLKHAKHVGHVHGEHAKHHAGRKARKRGGRTGADSHPFSSARHGSEPPGHKTEMECE